MRLRFIIYCLSFALLTFSVAQAQSIPVAHELSQPSSDEVPLGLMYALSEVQGQEETDFHFVQTDAGYIARNPSHQLEAVYADDAITMQYGDDSFSLDFASIGDDNSIIEIGDLPIIASSDNRLEIDYGTVTEWYVNGTRGIQQGFTLNQRPTDGAGMLQVHMTVGGTLRPSLSGGVLNLQDGNGNLKLTYGGLMAYDAQGQNLPAEMRLQNDVLTLAVDDSDAVYPITIGHVTQEAKLLPVSPAGSSESASNDEFGKSVAVDEDTMVIGVHYDDDNGSESGSAYVFIRAGEGWSLQAKLTAADGTANDRFGHWVAIDGDTVVVGARYDDENGERSGSAYVFTRTGTSWSQQAKLTASDAATNDEFGYSVDIDDDTIVVGAYGKDGIGLASGSAYVFTRTGTSWSQQTKLTANDAAEADFFGFSVAISDDTIVVGSPDDDDNGENSGSAYVFTRSGTTWSLQTKLTAADGTAIDWFGGAVAVDGDTTVIGAIGDDDDGMDSGSAYVFTRTGASWSQQAKLTASDAAIEDTFGYSVAVSGNTVVVGSPNDDENGERSGSAYVFTRTGSNWSQQAKLTATDGAAFDFFGEVVALSLDTIVVGARFDDYNGDYSGSAYVFTSTSGPSWMQQAKLTAASSDLFGWAVAVDDDTAVVSAYYNVDYEFVSGSVYVFTRSGMTWSLQSKLEEVSGTEDVWLGVSVAISGDTAVIGASEDDHTGSVYIFTRSGTTWTQQARLTTTDVAALSSFGWDVAVDGDTVVIGASGDDDNGAYSGSAYVFTRSGTSWTQQAKLTAADGAADDLFSESVAVSGDTVVIGSYGDDDNGADSGSAYVFTRSGTSWTQQTKLTAADAAANDYFGISVAMNGDTVVVGAYGDDDNEADSGSAYVFTRSGTSWTQQAKLTAADGALYDGFGVSVAMDGDTVVVGAYGDDDNGTDSGSAYIFTRSGTNWTQQAKLTAGDGTLYDTFGLSVATDDSTVLVGASYDDDIGSNSGSAYVFNILGETTLDIELSSDTSSSDEGASGISAPSLSLLVSGGMTSTDRTIELALTDGTATLADNDYSQSNSTITIPAGDYSTVQTIAIPDTALGIIGDMKAEPNENLTITLQNPGANAQIGDANGDSTTQNAAIYTINNDDTAGVTVSSTEVMISENGTTDTYTLALTSQPIDTVIITLTADAQCTVNPQNLTFVADNTAFDPQVVTVTAVDDDTFEGNHTCTITHSVSNSGIDYDSLAVQDVIAQIVDNDATSITITESELQNALIAQMTGDTALEFALMDMRPAEGRLFLTVRTDDGTVGTGDVFIALENGILTLRMGTFTVDGDPPPESYLQAVNHDLVPMIAAGIDVLLAEKVPNWRQIMTMTMDDLSMTLTLLAE